MTEVEQLKERIESSSDEFMDLIESLGADGLAITGSDGCSRTPWITSLLAQRT